MCYNRTNAKHFLFVLAFDSIKIKREMIRLTAVPLDTENHKCLWRLHKLHQHKFNNYMLCKYVYTLDSVCIMHWSLYLDLGSRSSAGDDISNHSWSHISCHILQRDILTSHQGVICHALSEQKCLERLPAETLIRSIIAVDHHMVSETCSVGILFAANSTLESSNSCEDNHGTSGISLGQMPSHIQNTDSSLYLYGQSCAFSDVPYDQMPSHIQNTDSSFLLYGQPCASSDLPYDQMPSHTQNTDSSFLLYGQPCVLSEFHYDHIPSYIQNTDSSCVWIIKCFFQICLTTKGKMEWSYQYLAREQHTIS